MRSAVPVHAYEMNSYVENSTWFGLWFEQGSRLDFRRSTGSGLRSSPISRGGAQAHVPESATACSRLSNSQKKNKAAMKSEPGETVAGDWGGGNEFPLPQSLALPHQSPRLLRLFSSFPLSESLEQATSAVGNRAQAGS